MALHLAERGRDEHAIFLWSGRKHSQRGGVVESACFQRIIPPYLTERAPHFKSGETVAHNGSASSYFRDKSQLGAVQGNAQNMVY